MKFCDVGVNIFDDMFQGLYRGKQLHPQDIDTVLQRAIDVGVTQSIFTGTSIAESRQTLDLCRQFGQQFELYCTAGIHPTQSKVFHQHHHHHNQAIIDSLNAIVEDGLNDGRIVALGELGLDYDRFHRCGREQQMLSFRAQLDYASKIHKPLPLFLHERNTGGDFYRVLREYVPHGCLRASGVVHSFTGNREDLANIIDLDLYVSINGCSLRDENCIDVVREIPMNRLLLETDAPWCSIKPTHHSYKHVKTFFPTKKVERYDPNCLVKDRNEPCTIVQVLEALAGIREQDAEELGNAIFENTQRLFFPSQSQPHE